MTETFTASNEIRVKFVLDDGGRGRHRLETITSDGENLIDGHDFLGREEIDALREFFQHERDEELGRWRLGDRSSSGYVVYLKSDGSVRVLEEITGQSEVVTRESVNDDLDIWFNEVADSYFAAHPEPKPWHDAKTGDVWVVTDNSGTNAYMVDDSQFYDSSRDYAIDFTDSDIITAERIWPEEK